MRLPITDRFLLLVFEFLEKTGETLEPPEIFKLKGIAYIPQAGGAEFWRSIERKRRRRQYAQFVYALKKRGFIKIAKLGPKRGILLTPKGRNKILRIKCRVGGKKKRKDKRWIMLMYDIPEKYRRERISFREFLQSLGYQKLQKSIWVTPYDLIKETEEAVRIFDVEDYIRIFLIEEISV